MSCSSLNSGIGGTLIIALVLPVYAHAGWTLHIILRISAYLVEFLQGARCVDCKKNLGWPLIPTLTLRNENHARNSIAMEAWLTRSMIWAAGGIRSIVKSDVLHWLSPAVRLRRKLSPEYPLVLPGPYHLIMLSTIKSGSKLMQLPRLSFWTYHYILLFPLLTIYSYNLVMCVIPPPSES